MGNWIRALRRVLDYAKDPDPNHWRTINGAKVHLDASGKYDGGAQGKFNGRYHYGPDWKTKSALMNRLAGALHAGAKKENQNNVDVTKKHIEELWQKMEAQEAKVRKASNLWFSDINNETYKTQMEAEKAKLQELQNSWQAATKEATERGIPFLSQEWKGLERGVSEYRLLERPPVSLAKGLKESEIIERISGGDETKGSCASAGLAYIANKAGFDVLDFRGGQSQKFFSYGSNLRLIAHLPGVDSTEKIVKVEARAAAEELLNLEKGKEYYFVAGGHAAIVRNTPEGPEYLELQSRFKERNGWTKLGNLKKQIIPRLNKRFGCAKSQRTLHGHKLNSRIIIIDVESLMKSKEFIKLVGYFNTSPEQQQKGAKGHVR